MIIYIRGEKMALKYSGWTRYEDEILINAYKLVPISKIAEKLNRTVISVSCRIQVLRQRGKMVE